jgi:hypothetical protein
VAAVDQHEIEGLWLPPLKELIRADQVELDRGSRDSGCVTVRLQAIYFSAIWRNTNVLRLPEGEDNRADAGAGFKGVRCRVDVAGDVLEAFPG